MIMLQDLIRGGRPMETFTKLFGLLVFVYHRFDRTSRLSVSPGSAHNLPGFRHN
jgi:hypothetical protein